MSNQINLFFLISILYVCDVNAYFDNSTLNFDQIFTDENTRFSNGQRKPRRTINKSRKFFSFDTKDDNLELNLEFSVPFVSLPVKNSLDNFLKTARTLVLEITFGMPFISFPTNSLFKNNNTASFKKEPLLNVNTGAIALTTLVIGAAVGTSILWKSFAYFKQQPPVMDEMTDQNSTMSITNTTDEPMEKMKDSRSNNNVWKIMDDFEIIFQQYDIDLKTCLQRTICSVIKDASENVSNGIGSSIEKILDGVTSIIWIRNIMKNTAIDDAINSGRHTRNCERKYSNCNIKNGGFTFIADKLLKSIL